MPRGGYRKGSGPKPKYDEPVKRIHWYVPVRLLPALKEWIKKMTDKG